MPDPNQNPFPQIRTPSELNEALQTADNLEREIADAKAQGVPSTSFEERLISVRDAVAQFQQGNAVSGGAPAAPGGSSSGPATDFTVSPGSPALENALAQPANEIPDAANPAPQNAAATDGTLSAANPSAGLLPTPATGGDGTPVAPGAAADAPVTLDGVAGAATAQTQQLQQSADRVRAVLEQNTGLTNSLFSQMLELLDSQNRQLGDVDRRILDLSGQLKSMKNP